LPEWSGRVENESIVINTGPLILLDKIDALDIAGKLPLRFICPPAVRMEIDAGIGHGNTAITPYWLKVMPLTTPFSSLVAMSLDRGEAEVIQLALDNGIANVCLDDRRGRRIAESLGLTVTGLLGLLGRAKHLGIINYLRPLADKQLVEGGWYSPKLINGFLADFGE
jgi:predicted nucleic acid-binding protein